MRYAFMAFASAVALASMPVLAGDSAALKPTGDWSLRETGSAPTPPMGWNSWNAFGTGITEAKVLGSAEIIQNSGLADKGYRSINIDDGWWLKRRVSDGRMQVRTSLFPSAATGDAEESSLRPFTDRLHAIGFKAGIYTDLGRNACAQAWSPNNPNLPEGTQAEREVGLYGHVEQDIALYFKDWNFDYIKVDTCGLSAYHPGNPRVDNGYFRPFGPLVVDANINQTNVAEVKRLFGEVRDALKQVRPSGDFVLSLCNWGSANVRSWGKNVGTIWRTSNDIDTTWGRMLHNFDSVATRELYAGPGHWNDPDMLEVGNGQFDADHLTEARTHMSLWAIAASPLIIGTDLTKAPQAIIDVLGAPEVIAVNQDPAGNQGVIAYTDSEREIIVKSLARPGEKAVVLFNRTNEPTDIALTAAHLKFAAGQPIQMRDLWARNELPSFTGMKMFHLAPHETIMLKVTGVPLAGAGRYLSEMTARINVAEEGINALEADPIIHRMIDPYNPSTISDGNRPLYAGWGGPRADASPYDQTLRIANVAYRTGLGVLANSRLEVKVKREFRRFIAKVGFDDSTRGKRAAVRFEVYGDGKRLAASRSMRFGQTADNITADIVGVNVVELIARQLQPDSGNVVVSWAEARVE